MLKLNFKLTSNDETKIDETVNYFLKDNKYNFKINDEIYILNIDNISLTKKNSEQELFMDFVNNNIVINIKEHNFKVDYPISKVSKTIEDNNILIEYFLEEENIKNTIKIKLD